jgi:hypothetical protein
MPILSLPAFGDARALRVLSPYSLEFDCDCVSHKHKQNHRTGTEYALVVIWAAPRAALPETQDTVHHNAHQIKWLSLLSTIDGITQTPLKLGDGTLPRGQGASSYSSTFITCCGGQRCPTTVSKHLLG